MKYAKPQVDLLQLATTAIEGHSKSGMTLDNLVVPTYQTAAAYQADE
jgi:hypothetical protein